MLDTHKLTSKTPFLPSPASYNAVPVHHDETRRAPSFLHPRHGGVDRDRGTRLMYLKVSFIHTDHTDSTCTALGTPSESTQNSVQYPKCWTLGMKVSTFGYIITLMIVSFFSPTDNNISPRCEIHLFSTASSESTRKTGLVRCL